MEKMKIGECALIEVNGLAEQLAVKAWEEETRNVAAGVLQVQHVGPDGEIKVEVSEEWASVYWSLVTAYKSLIMSYAANTQETRDNISSNTGEDRK